MKKILVILSFMIFFSMSINTSMANDEEQLINRLLDDDLMLNDEITEEDFNNIIEKQLQTNHTELILTKTTIIKK